MCKPSTADGVFYKKDVQYGIEAGYYFASSWRTAVNFDYAAFDVKNVENVGRNHYLAMPDYHSVKISSLSISLYKDLYIYKNLSMYMGLGCGLAYVRLYCVADPDIYSGSRYTLAGSFRCGLSYETSENWALIAGYKVIKISNLSFTPKMGLDEPWFDTPLLHCFEIGLRYTF